MIATGWDRIRAFGLDYVVVLAYLAILAVVGSFLTFGPAGAEWREWMADPFRADLVAFLVSVLPVAAYFTLGEASASGGTWGKRRLGLRVTGPGGSRITLVRSVVRTGLKLLPWQLAHTAMFHIPGFPFSPGDPPGWSPVVLAIAWALVGAYLFGLTRPGGRRTLYDRVAGTNVERAVDPPVTGEA